MALELRRLGQVSAHLAVRIRSGLLMPEYLQDQAIAVENRGVALLRGAAAHGQGSIRCASYGRERRTRQASKKAIPHPDLAAIFNNGEELLAARFR